ncbi:MAG: response regulator transcription factor [Saprospiraceae bacterium]|nr:response regulator transcription factor [Saprospiraceae bacterium]
MAVLKSWWLNLLLYGGSLGLLLASLQFSQYRLLMTGDGEKWYVGLVAVLFAATGIWAGRRLVAAKNPLPSPPPPPPPPKTETLDLLGITPRELEVLEQMALGLSNQEIAEKLFVSLNTVKTHTSNVFSKLGVQRRTQAIQKAKELELIF